MTLVLVPSDDSLPEIEEAWPSEFREAVVRQRLVTIGETCPCGASLGNAKLTRVGDVISVWQIHTPDCAAHESNYIPIIKAMVASRNSEIT